MGLQRESDIVKMLRLLVDSLDEFARSQTVYLSFSSDYKQLYAIFSQDEIYEDLKNLISNIIGYTPIGQHVVVKLKLIRLNERGFIKIVVENTGFNLSRISKITDNCQQTISVYPSLREGTVFEIMLGLEGSRRLLLNEQAPIDRDRKGSEAFLFRSQGDLNSLLSGPLSRKGNGIALVSDSQMNGGTRFIQKLNEIILDNMDRKGFNVSSLSRDMNMSRAQLYRKTDIFLYQSPGSYIKYLRLQKVLELFKMTDMNVSEIAFESGFQTLSHFSRVFKQYFGIEPSAFRSKKPEQTDKNLQHRD